MTKFSLNSWHARLYRSSWSREQLPSNLCPYFWAVVFAVLGFPMFIIAHIVNLFLKQKKWWVTSVSLASFTIILETSRKHWYWLIGYLCFLVIVFTGFFIMVYRAKRKIDRGDYREWPRLNGLFGERWAAFKGRYCPKITWLDKTGHEISPYANFFKDDPEKLEAFIKQIENRTNRK